MEGRHRHKRKGTLLRRKAGVVVFGVKLTPTSTIGVMSRQDPDAELALLVKILYPHDRQNFSKQVKFERWLIDIKPPKPSDSNLLAQSINAARFWGGICEASLDPYICPDMSIVASIRLELKAAFLIFALRWSGGQQAIGWELYVDTMSSAMSNVITAAKLKLVSPHAKFKICWHDGDKIEKYYGVNCTLSSDSGVSLESVSRNAARIYQIQQIEDKHPGWREQDPQLDWSKDSTADKAPSRAFVREEEVSSFSIEEECLLEVLSQPGVHLLNPDRNGYVGAGAFFGTGPDDAPLGDGDESIHPIPPPSPQEVLEGAISGELGLAERPLCSEKSAPAPTPSPVSQPPHSSSTPVKPTHFYQLSLHSSSSFSFKTPHTSDNRDLSDTGNESEDEEPDPEEFPPAIPIPVPTQNPYPRCLPLTTLVNGRPCAKSKFLADYNTTTLLIRR
ncbi:hypothetical protein P7C70_g5707, partial [Phenoliferia sp. Uapishka_3]